MHTNENANLKKQLLDSKKTIAELQEENQRFEKRVVELEAALLSKEQVIFSLTSAQKTFEVSLQAERERLQAAFELSLAEVQEQACKLQGQLEDLENENKALGAQRDSFRVSLGDYEKRFANMFSGQTHTSGGFKETNIQDIFNYEVKEKQKLNDKILELTQKLNLCERAKNSLEAENKKYREEFGVPSNFVHADDAPRNHVTRIGFLEREIEVLEEERAELKCKLRQMAAFVSPSSFDGDVFSQLSPEQKEAICLYAVNLLSGKKELAADDRSKELSMKCDKLAAENEVLKRENEQKHQAMMELAKNIRYLTSAKSLHQDQRSRNAILDNMANPSNGHLNPAFSLSNQPSYQNLLNPSSALNLDSHGPNLLRTGGHHLRPYQPPAHNLPDVTIRVTPDPAAPDEALNIEEYYSGLNVPYPNQANFSDRNYLSLRSIGNLPSANHQSQEAQRNAPAQNRWHCEGFSNADHRLDPLWYTTPGHDQDAFSLPDNSKRFVNNANAKTPSFNKFEASPSAFGHKNILPRPHGLGVNHAQLSHNTIGHSPDNANGSSQRLEWAYEMPQPTSHANPQRALKFGLSDNYGKNIEEIRIKEQLSRGFHESKPSLLKDMRSLKEKLSSENVALYSGELNEKETKPQAGDDFGRKPNAEASEIDDDAMAADEALHREFKRVKEILEDQVRFYNIELGSRNQTIQALETQNAQLRLIFESFSKDAALAPQINLARANDDLARENCKLAHESEIYRLKIGILSKRVSELEAEVHLRQPELQRAHDFEKSYHESLSRLFVSLYQRLEQSVPLLEYKNVLFSNESLRQQLSSLQSEIVYNADVQKAYKALHSDYSRMADEVSSAMTENFSLLCELQMLESRLCRVDEEYFHFKSLLKSLIEGIRDKHLSPDDFLAKFMNETLDDKLSDSSICTIFKHFGVKLAEMDVTALKRFMGCSSLNAIFKDDFIRKVNLYTMNFRYAQGERGQKVNFEQLHRLDSILERTGFDSSELFKLFDYKSAGAISLDDVCQGLAKFGLCAGEDEPLRETIKRVFFEYDQRIDAVAFKRLLEGHQLNGWKQGLLTKKELSWEVEIGQMLNEFLKANKAKLSNASALFHFIDQQANGYLRAIDFELFFKEYAGLEIDGSKIEKFCSTILSLGSSGRITESAFRAFLNNCQVLARVNESALAADDPKVLFAEGLANSKATASSNVELKMNFLRDEINAKDFKAKQLKTLIAHQKEQMSLMEAKEAESTSLIAMYRNEISKLYEELHRRKARGPATATEERGPAADHSDWWNLKEEATEAQLKGLIQTLKKQVQAAKQERAYLLQRVQRVEEEALDIFLATAKIAADKEMDIAQTLQQAYYKSQEVLHAQRLTECSETIGKLNAQIQDMEVQMLEERTRAQSYIENLSERHAVLQLANAQHETCRAPSLDYEHVNKMSVKIKAMSAQVIKLEEECRVLAERNKDLELAVIKEKLNHEACESLKSAAKIGSENQLLEKLRGSILDLKALKTEKAKIEKELSYQLNNQRLLQTALATSNEATAQLEKEVQKQIDLCAQRELFWSDRYQSLMAANTEIAKFEKPTARQPRQRGSHDSSPTHAEAHSIQNLINENANGTRLAHEARELMDLKRELGKARSDNELLKKAIIRQQSLGKDEAVATPMGNKETTADSDTTYSNMVHTAQKAVSVLQGLLDVKQAELADSQREVHALKGKLAELEQKYQSVKMAMAEFPDGGDRNEVLEGHVAFGSGPKSKTSSRNGFGVKSKRGEHDSEPLLAKEKAMLHEISQLKQMNRDLVERIRTGITYTASPANIHPAHSANDSSEAFASSQVAQLKEKNRSLEEALKGKEKEVASLLEALKSLKNELVEQSKANVSEKALMDQKKSEFEKVKSDYEGRLKLSAQRAKEFALKLKESGEEVAALKAKNIKNEESIKRLNKENIDLNLALSKRLDEVTALKAKLDNGHQDGNGKDTKDAAKRVSVKENDPLSALKTAKPLLAKAHTEIPKEPKTVAKGVKPLLPMPVELKADLKKE